MVDLRSAYFIERIATIKKQMKEWENKVNKREMTQEQFTKLKKDAEIILYNLKEQLN
jgi:hypothetical protein